MSLGIHPTSSPMKVVVLNESGVAHIGDHNIMYTNIRFETPAPEKPAFRFSGVPSFRLEKNLHH